MRAAGGGGEPRVLTNVKQIGASWLATVSRTVIARRCWTLSKTRLEWASIQGPTCSGAARRLQCRASVPSHTAPTPFNTRTKLALGMEMAHTRTRGLRPCSRERSIGQHTSAFGHFPLNVNLPLSLDSLFNFLLELPIQLSTITNSTLDVIGITNSTLNNNQFNSRLVIGITNSTLNNNQFNSRHEYPLDNKL